MTKRMLIDASHAEETRVVVLDGNRLEDFDVETQSRRQLKGNIYLAKVVRVEPSLQAAFVEYGGNRHGFLAFGEIHPDYYQIPIADRQRLLAMQEEEARAEEEAEDEEPAAATEQPGEAVQAMPIAEDAIEGEAVSVEPPESDLGADTAPEAAEPAQGEEGEQPSGSRVRQVSDETQQPEISGGEPEAAEEQRTARSVSRFMRSYKIQEVIRRRQILLIQVVKEERGTKGAALTTYISLAGRYCVLMPNSPRGGGISRKITSASDRRRLKEVTAELDLPRGMGLIVRTAGAMRPKPEIKRDGEYLLRLWDDIRERTMASMAPALIHEEATLIKRAIRDVYSRDVDDLVIDGEDGWRAAREFMRMLMPTHVKKVQLWPQGGQPLFAHSQVESMLDSMLNPTVQLRSGGYLVINQTEALVAIDVNSGRSTRERGIEETALRTNLEAAEETARQLRLRDLAGLIVIDFIDMESKKHNAMVERRMAEALKNDRARIQIGHISHFGLMELSRQRLRPSLAETSLTLCGHCGGTGHVRSTESAALHVLREIEEEGGRQRAAEICVHVAGVTALYILNHKRERLREIEQRYRMQISFAADETLLASQTRIQKIRDQVPAEVPVAAPVRQIEVEPAEIEEDEAPDIEETPAPREAASAPAQARDPDAVPGETAEEGEQRRRRRRRRRRGGRREEGVADTAPPLPVDAEQPDIFPAEAEPAMAATTATEMPEPAADHTPEVSPEQVSVLKAEPEPALVPVPGHDEAAEAEAEQAQAKKRSRGGRRRKPKPEAEAEAVPVAAAYAGPTPADPFGGALDIFDVMDRFENAPAPTVPAPALQLVPNGVIEVAAGAPEPALPEPALVEPGTIETIETIEPEPAEAVATAAPIQPILIGAVDPAAEKKRGWWRR